MADFSTLGYDEAMRRARECVPVLASRAQKCEDARVLLPENEKLLHEAGLFRFHQPKRFGGMELPFQAIVDIVSELARGCPSTAWNVGNLGCHHWILAYYEPETQHEVWDANPDALIASSIALAAGRGRKTKEGYVVSGRWPFSSGVDNSGWNMLAVTIYDDEKAVDWRLCLVPKGDYTIIDTWYAMGMVGTGSKDIEAKEVFVPERRALALARCRGGSEHPGASLNQGPLYKVPIVAAAGHPLSASALGAAEGAYQHVAQSFAKRVGTYTGAKVADFQAVQVKLARARCLVDSARHLMRESAVQFQTFADEGKVPDLETKLRFRAQNAFAVAQSREAVETLWSFYGANAIYTRDPLQRFLRDTQAIGQHFSFNFDIAGAAYGTTAMGGRYANPTL
ncbi:MAG: acyl-CoA dehydrogenase [Burkholderiales bacterium]|jgi:3-hydroxy-9,10-secoandrosta-1,3,5(10)-triene-9,17-dione monooxygenase|nr:acyl-CoA dehydrogenase [Burkholderiales bacterium]